MDFYVINLDRAPDRWRYMQAMCAERGIAPQRITAIEGNALGAAELDRICPAVDGLRALTPTEIGCFESHRQAWRRIVEGEAPFACVLEDDVYLARDIDRICRAIADACPGLGLVKLNSYRVPIYLAKTPVAAAGPVQLFRPMQRTTDSGAYLISRDCARAALAAFETYDEAIDERLFDPVNGWGIAQAVPAVAVQAEVADFAFLDADASKSVIESGRAERLGQEKLRQRREKARRGRQPLPVKLGRELRRFWRRRIADRVIGLTNLLRPPEERIVRRTVVFADP